MEGNQKLFKMVFLAFMVALGVVISPILRVEGMCPMAHFINVTCAVLMGPYWAFLCALLIGIIRMAVMGIPPLALTGAIFGAFLSGMFYRLSKGKLVWAFLGEVIGTGIIGAIISYPVMTFIWGRSGLTWFFYVPSFIAGTLIGGSIAFIFLRQLVKAGLLTKFQRALGSDTYGNESDVKNNAIAIGLLGFIASLVTVVIVHNFVPNPSALVFIMPLTSGRKQFSKTETFMNFQNVDIKKIKEIREHTLSCAPLIHCITNPISINDCANTVLLTGAKPIMAEHPDEVAGITAIAGALAVNHSIAGCRR